ncbi:MAG: hypothetical protein J6X18_16285 [Bacteroidales bacterium]|nr:hypothetical protein [Bacteroidales bacterium]
MSTQAIGAEITTYDIAQGNQIPIKTPDQLGYTNVYHDNLRYDNDPDKRWTVLTDPYDGYTLAEGSAFEYGCDINVQANWLYRVEIVPWLRLGTQTEVESLRTTVRVEGYYYDYNDLQTHYYCFTKPQHESVTFNIAGINNRTVYVSGLPYTFIGWASSEPAIFYTDTDPFSYDSPNVSYYLPVIQFSDQYIKKEWAAFFKGFEMKLRVTTNVSEFNNNDNIRYYLHVEDVMSVNPRQFQSIPAENGNSHIIIPPSQYSLKFKCEYINGQSNTKVFRGWYYGHWTDSTIPEGQNWFPYESWVYTSPRFFFDAEIITLTAVFTEETGPTYTITYWSGLPNDNQ